MWLLKLHFAISVLCLLTFVGFKIVYKGQIIKNGYSLKEGKSHILNYWLFFIPLLNVGSVITLLVMIAMKKDDLDKYKKDSGDEKGE